MSPIRRSLLTALVSFTFFGCSNPSVTTPSASPNALPTQKTTATSTTATTTTSSTVTASPTPTAQSSPSNRVSIGDITEIKDDKICDRNKVMYAYGETLNYHIYICADAKDPERPRYYISRNKDGSGGLNITATNYNPQRTDVIEFKNDAYLYTLEAPSTQNPEPVLRITFPNGKLSEERLLRYFSRTDISTQPPQSSNTPALLYVLQNRESLGICKDEFRDQDGQTGLGSRAFKITDQKYLVQIQCFLAAYQGAFEYVLWVNDSPQPRVIPLEFDSFQEAKAGETPTRISSREIAGIPRFNPRSQILTNFTKFRGLGDCGSSALYKLEGERMVLQEYRAKYECDGEYIKDFPIVYP